MDRKHKLFVDCQVFQYNAWHRGMGRYSLKLIEALNNDEVDITLIFNSNIELESDRLNAIKQACPDAKLLYLKLSCNPNKFNGWLGLQKKCSKQLDQQLQGIIDVDDTYLIASNFSLRFCSTFPSLECRRTLIFYDLTPYIQWGHYRNTQDFNPKKYFAQFETIFAADQLWSISESAANEVKYWLGISESKIKNIRGASIRDIVIKPSRPTSIEANQKFILSPTGDGPHKNNENAVRAFTDFNLTAGGAYSLVLTSNYSIQSKSALNEISNDLIFTGHISNDELEWLYQNCEAELFVSKNEGLGLPILEGVAAGKKVICSDIEVFKEISAEAFYCADPYNIQSISKALNEALIQGTGWQKKRQRYSEVNNKFSWPATAKVCKTLMNETITKNIYPNSSNLKIYYSDPDEISHSRNIAEILYGSHPDVDYRSMRSLKYKHVFPSFLPEMGVAKHALEDSNSDDQPVIYFIDDTKEGSRLLLFAIQHPGILFFTFSKDSETPNLNETLSNLSDRLNFSKLILLLEAAGNKLFYRSDFAQRGTSKLISEVNGLFRLLEKELF